ncbi:hypothetical protein GDI2766 [Gluconacetobacter diazotrophicus PA1 5]|uniref:Uncharacterized protein n=1 Tax=Gluconacetobacter diazotrophicus (strain ATCC 49037 / DSM 5601 / CCUG 37298 / CIP 103539 / LMG 7603 / PAl5) TaxID=272568 RepID=A9HQB5_GLUDA|nr:hypothetical protein GDI2766 [Gluconacetobacter diazotrophicus PA1 5]
MAGRDDPVGARRDRDRLRAEAGSDASGHAARHGNAELLVEGRKPGRDCRRRRDDGAPVARSHTLTATGSAHRGHARPRGTRARLAGGRASGRSRRALAAARSDARHRLRAENRGIVPAGGAGARPVRAARRPGGCARHGLGSGDRRRGLWRAGLRAGLSVRRPALCRRLVFGGLRRRDTRDASGPAATDPLVG